MAVRSSRYCTSLRSWSNSVSVLTVTPSPFDAVQSEPSSVENLAIDPLNTELNRHAMVGQHLMAKTISIRCGPQISMDCEQLVDGGIVGFPGNG